MTGSAVVLGVLLLISTYGAYVAVLVTRADFYTRGQKIAQVLIAVLVPLLGPVVVHWVYMTHRAPAHTADRAFIPQRDPPPEEGRAHHRPADPPGD